MAMAYVQIDSGGQSRRIELKNEPILIGRVAGNTLVLEDALISRKHCLITQTPNGASITDLGSSNGTYVNGERIVNAILRTGDVITVGHFDVRFFDENQPAAPLAPPIALQPAHEPPPETAPDDVLDESDLVDDSPDIFGGQAQDAATFEPASQDALPDDHESVLLRLAESLPDKSFQDFNIALLTARGTVAHAATTSQTQRTSDSNDAVRLLRLILLVCFRTNASDIHVEPREKCYQIRIRVDGTMVDVVRLEKGVSLKLTSLVKILCDIDIAQRSAIQEGHFATRTFDRRVDYRVSFAPSVHGQKLVVRILDARSAPLRADQLKLPPWQAQQLIRATALDSGVVLVCGPTGSGKTTTLYSLIRTLDTTQRNVITIEDPVEIQLAGVTQLPVNDEQGNSFAALLRSVLRQDPDIILVGEIRDPETAKIAMQAAITGHLVFSTLHTRDTIGTVFRLLDLGVEPYMLAQGLNIVLAQRLVRQLCPHCKIPAKLTAEQIQSITTAVPSFKQAFARRGCPRCMGTGYTGRRGVFEMLIANEKLRDAILHNRSNAALQEALAGTGFTRLLNHGYQLVADGATSLDEVERAVG